jgi:DNA-binding transcriptional regulator YiaG
MYHYTESGLDNVWLANGYTVIETPYGKGVSVRDADGLLQAIAIRLVHKAGRLTGRELRFLRSLLCLSQQSLGPMVGATEQSVSLWERTGKVPRGADAIVRMIVLEKLNGDGKVTQIIDRINTVERLVNQQIVARARDHRWTTREQAERPELEAA